MQYLLLALTEALYVIIYHCWSVARRNFVIFSLRPLVISMIISLTSWDILGHLWDIFYFSYFFYFYNSPIHSIREGFNKKKALFFVFF